MYTVINMKRTWTEIKKQTEEWLDERYMIAHLEDLPRVQDLCYYNGAVKALEFAGYTWYRDTNGKHTLYKKRITKRLFLCNLFSNGENRYDNNKNL